MIDKYYYIDKAMRTHNMQKQVQRFHIYILSVLYILYYICIIQDAGTPQPRDSTHPTKDGETPANKASTHPTDGGNPQNKEKSTRSRDGGNSIKSKNNPESTRPSSDAGNPGGESLLQDVGNSQGTPYSDNSTEGGWDSDEGDRSDASQINPLEGNKSISSQTSYMAIKE